MAKRYSHIEEVPFQTYTDGRPAVYKTMLVPHSKKLFNEIYRLAYKAGWDGCHWDSPFLLEVDDEALREWEEERGWKSPAPSNPKIKSRLARVRQKDACQPFYHFNALKQICQQTKCTKINAKKIPILCNISY